MKNTHSKEITASSAGATTGFGAALACSSVFNVVAADPTFALFVCASVGVATGVAAKRVFQKILNRDEQSSPGHQSKESTTEPPSSTL